MTTNLMNIPLDYKYIGNTTCLTTKGHLGDVCLYNGRQYVYAGATWEPIIDYGIPIHIYDKPKAIICSQCGAPLFGNICEYCGTRYG